MKAWEMRCFAALKRLHGIERPVIAEIGIGRGYMSKELLRHPTLHLHMVDNWLPRGEQPKAYRDTGDFFAGLTPDHCDVLHMMARTVAKAHPGRVTIHHADSVEAARDFKDGALDLVFLDGDHSYEGCKRDIGAWLPKVKRGGWLGGHDYNNVGDARFDFTGVARAVDEFPFSFGVKIEEDLNFTWWVQR